jgi:hypothetical protein
MGSVADSDQSTMVMQPDGSLLTAGVFEGSADFDHGDTEVQFNASSSKDIFIVNTAANGDFVWAKQIRSINNLDHIYLYDLQNDGEGNFYITGSYISPVDFDPDPTIEYLVDEVDAANYDQDIFIAKYNANGEFIWVKTIGSFNTDIGKTIDILSNGNVIVTGEFQYQVDFNPGPEVAMLSTSNNAIFLLTLTSDGDYVDAKFLSGTSNSFNIYSTKMDANDNLYLTGGFYGTADFDPGPSTYSVTASGSGATRFICKLDNNLSCIWVKSFNMTSLSGIVRDIEIDDTGALFIAGSFWGGIDLDPNPETSFDLVSAGYSDSFVAKLDADGTFIWGKQFGGVDSDEAITLEFINNGDLLVGINIRSATIDLDPGADTQLMTNGGSYDLALVELSGDGEYHHHVQFTGGQLQQVNDLIVTPTAIYTSGTFSGGTDFDPGDGTATLYPDESWDYFIHKMSMTPSVIKEETSGINLTLFPNPAHDILNIIINGDKNKYTIEIFDLAGSLMKNINTTASFSSIDISELASGIYFIVAKDVEGHTISQMVEKQ